ncbi:MAG: PEPxxWA-CTERM sorting domain-containing protein [Pseudomonadota bacterium]
MKNLAALSAVFAIGLTAAAGQAQAVVYTYTQVGTVSSGIDTKGLFGQANANLAGKTFSASFTFDTELADVEDFYRPDLGLLRQRGTSAAGTITIDGIAYAIDVKNYGYRRSTAGGYFGTSFSAVGDTGGMEFGVESLASFLPSPALTSPESYTITDEDRTLETTRSHWNWDDSNFVFRGDKIFLTSELDPPVTGVPEPTSWALMMGGFGLVGATMRRRRELPTT